MCCSMASSPTGTSPRRRGRESSSSADAGPPPPPPPFDLPAPRRPWEPLVEGPRGATTDPGLTLAATTTTSKNTWIADGSCSPLVGDNPGYSSGGGREGGGEAADKLILALRATLGILLLLLLLLESAEGVGGGGGGRADNPGYLRTPRRATARERAAARPFSQRARKVRLAAGGWKIAQPGG